MFHRTTDASKVALVHLVVVMNEGGGSLLDVQWQTPHLESLGAEIIGREVYLAELEKALTLSGAFAGSSNDPKG
jgi:leucyl/phenylalanyl-tRNA--protein transferase